MPIDQKIEDTLPVLRTVLSPVDSLTEALVAERRLIDDLISIMRKQRNAVGDDDLQVVDDSVFATHRVLVTRLDGGEHAFSHGTGVARPRRHGKVERLFFWA